MDYSHSLSLSERDPTLFNTIYFKCIVQKLISIENKMMIQTVVPKLFLKKTQKFAKMTLKSKNSSLRRESKKHKHESVPLNIDEYIFFRSIDFINYMWFHT